MNLTEAEIQVLAQLRGAELESEPMTRDSVDKRAERYWIYREDWDDAPGQPRRQGAYRRR